MEKDNLLYQISIRLMISDSLYLIGLYIIPCIALVTPQDFLFYSTVLMCSMSSIEICKRINKENLTYKMEKEVICWLIENLSENDVWKEPILTLIRELLLMGLDLTNVKWFENQKTVITNYFAHINDIKTMINDRLIDSSLYSRAILNLVNRTWLVKYLPGFISYYTCECFCVAAENLYSFVKVYCKDLS